MCTVGPTWINTDRLRLTRPERSDVARTFAIHADERTYRHLPSGVMTSPEDAEALLEVWLAHWREHDFGYAAVRRHGEDLVIGFAGAKHQTLRGVSVLNLYYRFDPDSWGRGLATEAAAGVKAELSRTHPGLPLVARVARNNPASIAVAERLGLRRLTWGDPGDPVPHWLYSSDG